MMEIGSYYWRRGKWEIDINEVDINPSLVENYIEADGERIMGHERLGYLPQEMLDEDKEKTIYEYFSEEEIF